MAQQPLAQSLNGHAQQPTFGFTWRGKAVHARWLDHYPTHNIYHRTNKALAVWITTNIGTMTCFWVFSLIAIMSLPAVMVEAKVVPPSIGVVGSIGFVILIQWLAQSFLQLVLLPSLMVGQNLQNQAADARAEKTFTDVEVILDRLDTHTEEGLSDVLAYLRQMHTELVDHINATKPPEAPLATSVPPG
jgi:hypothetical protein